MELRELPSDDRTDAWRGQLQQPLDVGGGDEVPGVGRSTCVRMTSPLSSSEASSAASCRTVRQATAQAAWLGFSACTASRLPTTAADDSACGFTRCWLRSRHRAMSRAVVTARASRTVKRSTG